jgi:hypothetical protein
MQSCKHAPHQLKGKTAVQKKRNVSKNKFSTNEFRNSFVENSFVENKMVFQRSRPRVVGRCRAAGAVAGRFVAAD